MGILLILCGLVYGPFLGVLLYAALFQRDQVKLYRGLHVGGNPSEWSNYIGGGEPW